MISLVLWLVLLGCSPTGTKLAVLLDGVVVAVSTLKLLLLLLDGVEAPDEPLLFLLPAIRCMDGCRGPDCAAISVLSTSEIWSPTSISSSPLG